MALCNNILDSTASSSCAIHHLLAAQILGTHEKHEISVVYRKGLKKSRESLKSETNGALSATWNWKEMNKGEHMITKAELGAI